jgi:hypothetical protein
MNLKTWMLALLGFCLGINVAVAKDTTFELQQALENQRPVMVLTTASDCTACEYWAETLQQLSPWVADKAQLSVLDIERYPSLAGQHQLDQAGTFYFIQGGEVLDQISLKAATGHIPTWIANRLFECQDRSIAWMGGCDPHTFEVFMSEYTDASREALYAEILALVTEYQEFDVEISGDSKAGNFSVKVPLFGRMEGTYKVVMPYERDDADPSANQGGLLTLQVTSKPFLLACSAINSLVDSNMPKVGERLGVEIVRYQP